MARVCKLPVLFEVELSDISTRGIGFRCVWAVSPGDQIVFSLPGLGLLRTIATVRHARADGDKWVVGAELSPHIRLDLEKVMAAAVVDVSTPGEVIR